MVILQIVNFDSRIIYFIRVEPRYHNLVKRINGRFLQEPGEDKDINTLYDLLGGDDKFKIARQLGFTVESPVGCEAFYTFFYD